MDRCYDQTVSKEKTLSFTFMLVNPRTLMSRFITSGSEHMYRRYWEMPIGNTLALALDSILADCQHIFQSQRSYETQLVQFVHDIISHLDRAVNHGHKPTDLIMMDFAHIPQRRLLHKFDYYGIRGSTHRWINKWISGPAQQEVLDGQSSDPVPVYQVYPKDQF